MAWYWIPLIWLLAGVVSFGLAAAFKNADRQNGADFGGLFPTENKPKQSRHWTEDMADPEEHPQRHWTEFLDNSDEATDRDDDWEWERQDDFGDSWDGDED